MRPFQGASPLATILLVLILLGGFLAATSWAVVAAVAVIACDDKTLPAGLWGGVVEVIAPTARLGTCGPAPQWAARILIVVVVIAIAIGGVLVYTRWEAYKKSEKKRRKDLRLREGLATRREILDTMSAKARLAKAGTVRPGLPNPRPEDVGVRVGKMHGIEVWLSTEDSVVLEGAPRSGKGFRIIIGAILDWQGPLITTSTRTDNLLATMAMREQVGTVTVFDPQGISGIRNTMRISPITGCEDEFTASQRAAAIMGGTAIGASSTNQEWAQESETILSRLLLAAAVGNKDVSVLRDWGASPSLARPAVDILRADGPAGWGDALEATLDDDPKLLQSKWMGVAAALKPLQLRSVAEAMTPTADSPLFDPDEFLAGPNTLYLLGTKSGAGASGGFLGAILDDIVEHARRKAARSKLSRLNPPLGLILDELANLFAWRQLPIVLSDGGGIGIWTLVVLQALSQAETAWSQAEAETIWSSSIAKILLGGASNVGHLRDVEVMLGERRQKQTSKTMSIGANTSYHDSLERVPIISAAELRQLPEGMGVLAYKNRRGILLDLDGWIARPDAAEIKAGMKRTEQLQAEGFARR